METVPENLVDYFFICGLDSNIGLDSYEATNENDESDIFHCFPPLKRPYKPSILQKFPDHCGSYPFPEDYSITSLCMPDGLRLFSESSLLLTHPINHNFIVIREDASRIYGTALLFAEEVTNNDIKLAVTDLQNMFKMGHNLSISKVQHHSSCSDCTVDDNNGGVVMNTAMSPRDSGNFSVCSIGDFWSEDEKLYAIKSIGILSQHAYISCHESWLYDLWWYVLRSQSSTGPDSYLKESEQTKQVLYEEESSDVDLDPADIKLDIKPKINLESYIYNLLFEINAPKCGKIISIEGPNMKHYCRSPDKNDLPVFELPMRGLLEVLGLENLIRLFSCVLLEYRVVVLSKDYRLLMLVSDCITCLLFPFVWSHVYAPILPLAARHFLNAPLPFIMGIRMGSNEDEESIQLASEACVCYVNIDKQVVQTPDGIPSFPFELELRKAITDLMLEHGKEFPLNSESRSNKQKHTRPQSQQQQTTQYSKLPPRPSSSSTSNYNSKPAASVSSSSSSSSSLLPSIASSAPTYDELVDAPQNTSDTKKQMISNDNKLSGLQSNEKLSREATISIHNNLYPVIEKTKLSDKIEHIVTNYMNMLKFNHTLRELFLNHFLHIFFEFDQYIIPPKSNCDMDTYFSDRESAVQNFDKASFLSEQPETHLSFLSAFLETQMFANFIDMKMLSNWQVPHPNLVIFERKLNHLKQVFTNEMSQCTNNEFIGMRPYRSYIKSTGVIKQTAALYRSNIHEAITTRTSVRPHILKCNDPSATASLTPECPSNLTNNNTTTSDCDTTSSSTTTNTTPSTTSTTTNLQSFCSVHHHHHQYNNTDDGTHVISTDDELYLLSVLFPELQGDCLRNKPRKKSTNTKPTTNVSIVSISDLNQTNPLQQHPQYHHHHQQHQHKSKLTTDTNSLPRVHQHNKPDDSLSNLTNITNRTRTSRQKNRSTPDPNMVGSAALTGPPPPSYDLAVDTTEATVSHKLHSVGPLSTGDFVNPKENRARRDPKPYFPNMVPNVMAQNHWGFVNALLQETKAKTKRMVLEKMGGQEAQELGHGDLFVSDIEENTLVAGLCDLLERIWCHGLDHKQGKSALWTHLIKFVERDQKKYIIKRTQKENIRKNNGSSLQDKQNTTKNEMVKNALTGVGIDSYRLFRFFNENQGEINSGGYVGSLKKLSMMQSPSTERKDLSNSTSKSGHSHTHIRSSTPDFYKKHRQVGLSGDSTGVSVPPTNRTSSSGSNNLVDLFSNWSLMGSLGRKSNSNQQPSSSSGGVSKLANKMPAGQIELTSIFGPERRSLVSDVKSVQNMTDIKTDVGFARAFVRLALEKKLLSEHLKKLLSDTNLLRELYKRHAFLRCEEEREQFLFHLLALQAVEYYSFTNLYVRGQLVYRVFISTGIGGFSVSNIGSGSIGSGGASSSLTSNHLGGSSGGGTGGGGGGGGSRATRFARNGVSTTANVWFCINGQHCGSGMRTLPKGLTQFEFENQNMGILTTMRLGHDNSGMSPKWFVEYVLVQNVITGHVYRFLCNHWLGKGVDDGSTERLLVGELIRFSEEDIKNSDSRSSKLSLVGLQTPPRSRSPSVNRKMSDGKIITEVASIQEQLGNAVNNLFKYYCRLQDREKTIPTYHTTTTTSRPSNIVTSTPTSVALGSCHVTLLLCGEYGLVSSMERVFQYGFHTSRLFQKKYFIWDYIEKTATELAYDLSVSSQSSSANGPTNNVRNSPRSPLPPQSPRRRNSKKRDSIILPNISNLIDDSIKNSTSVDSIRFSSEMVPIINQFCRLVERISNFSDSVGKDGKFQKLICIGIREHAFPDWIELFALVDTTQQFYDESSFFRDPHLREFLVKILSSLSEFNITLEPALIDGL